MNALTSHLTTRCVGRYLIDVPAEVASFGTTQVSGVDIEAKAMSLDDYHKAMKARSDELRATKSFFGYRFLYADTVIEGIPESRYFLSLGNANAMTDAERLVEMYRWDRGYQIKMRIAASNAKDSVYFKNKPRVKDDPDMTNVSAKAQLVVSLLSRARGRTDDEIPNEPGACFQGGFLVGPQWDSEKIEAYFVLPAHRDVSFSLETNTDVHDDTTLLQRGKEINAALTHDPNGKAIRNGHVALTGMIAEEWLMQKTTVFKIPGFLFSMEANSLPNNDQKPVVMLDMRVGAPSALTDDSATIDKASLIEGEAVGLWDAVSRTLRPRPNAF